jgi:hypothetical protein
LRKRADNYLRFGKKMTEPANTFPGVNRQILDDVDDDEETDDEDFILSSSPQLVSRLHKRSNDFLRFG